MTLLNCDYKIATKAIANRIKIFLPKLISDDQTGFIKNRFIGENILLIDSVIRYTAARNILGLLLFLDFEKAFDTLEWTFIQKTFKYFGYGPQLLKWINIFYCNIESCILNNGWASNFFKPTRGVRQGCPFSPYLFVLSVEVMAEAFRKNEKIRGITVKAKNIKLSQYADDTTLILDGSIEFLEESLRLLDLFGEVSGLRLNCGKTEALWIGAKVNSDLKLCPDNNYKWPKGKVKALGFWFSSDSNITVSHNYIDKVEKVKAMLSCWKFRRLSLLGKITVIKSLAVSQLVYILAPLQTDHKAIIEINVLFYKFLWDGKGDKIKRNVMINDFSEGGLKMIDIESFNKSLKSSWIKKHLDPGNSSSWKSFFDLELQSHGGKTIFLGNLTRKDARCFIEVSDPFIKEILEIWCEASFTENLTSEAQFLSSPLWYNSHIKIGNRPVFFKDWSLKGITEVKHILNDSFEFLSLTAFQDKYNLQVPPLSYYGIISATNSLRRQSERTNDSYDSFLSKFLKNSKPSRLIYKKLVSIIYRFSQA